MMQEGRDFCYQFAFLHYVGELTTSIFNHYILCYSMNSMNFHDGLHQYIQSLYTCICYSMNFHYGLRYRPKSKMSLGLQFIYSIAFLPSRQRCPRFL